MAGGQYDYTVLESHPSVQGYYAGWLGQQIRYLADAAVRGDAPHCWDRACAEAHRLMTATANCMQADALETAANGEAWRQLLWSFSAGGWWNSPEGQQARVAPEEGKGDGLSDEEIREKARRPDRTLVPAVAVVSGAQGWWLYQHALDQVLEQIGQQLGQRDMIRLGAFLAAGLGCAWEPGAHPQ
jgi:hypothetical protein